jgi:hypothetical protein
MSLNLSFSACGTASIPRPNIAVSGCVKHGQPSGNAPSAKNYVSNGYTMNNSGYLANPSRSAQVSANNAGALTRSEASRMGLPLGGRR